MKNVKILSSGMLGVSFSGDDFVKLKDEIKTFPDRRWVPSDKYWEVPNSKFVRDRLVQLGFVVPPIKVKKVFDRDIQPMLYEFQKLAVKKIGSLNGRCLIAAEMGCVSGEAEVSINRAGITRKYKLRDVFEKFNGGGRDKWNLSIETKMRCLKSDGLFGLNTVENVLYKGVKDVVEVETDSGKIIRLTLDHEVYSGEWVPIDCLEVGDKIQCDGKKVKDFSDHKYKHNNGYIARYYVDIFGGRFIYWTGSEVVMKPVYEKIVRKDYVGKESVYDVVMRDPDRNFVANGIVVHNCGKTVMSLAYVSLYKEERPVVIVVPASVKLNWIREIHKWTEGETPIVINGRKPFYCKGFSMVIINYDILPDHVEYLIKLNPKMVIADEVQMVKNTGAQRSKALKRLSRSVDNMIALSGTPILNKPAEFWSILNMLRPDVWKRKIPYLYRYCSPENNGFGMKFDGASNTNELNEILNEEVMYRVLKKDVLTQLPDKVFTAVPFEIDKRKYRMAEIKLTQSLQDNNGVAEALVRFGEMRMVAVEEKMPMVIEWISDFIETDGKLVVFGIHHKVIDRLMKEFSGKAVKVDGRDNQDKREKAIRRFQDDDSIRLFIGNVEAAGVGIDGLQRVSSSVAFVELPWVPAMIDQASDRLHRIGQKDSVNVYFLIADGTVEQYIAEAVDRKRVVLDSVLDGKDTSEGSFIIELMNRYKRGEK